MLFYGRNLAQAWWWRVRRADASSVKPLVAGDRFPSLPYLLVQSLTNKRDKVGLPCARFDAVCVLSREPGCGRARVCFGIASDLRLAGASRVELWKGRGWS